MSESRSCQHFNSAEADGQTDADVLSELTEQAELECFDADDAQVISDAIERLYFMSSVKSGGAVYPNERIRAHLRRLDASVVCDAISKITRNTAAKIRNSSAYVVTVLFNTIMESGSDLMVDPYLNYLRSRPGRKPVMAGGG